MGLTASSTGRGAVDSELHIQRLRADDRVIALAGNPNVGKSTVFNALTGLHQHTGNWPGKTIANAQGRFERAGRGVVLVDIPGTYSLIAHSEEEAVARDYLCFGHPDGVAIVCDAACLERNLNLVLQILEITPRAVVCVNLMDEARKKHWTVDCAELQRQLGVPVIPAAARAGEGMEALAAALCAGFGSGSGVRQTRYPKAIEEALDRLQPLLEQAAVRPLAGRWTALRLLENRTELAMRSMQDGGVPDAVQRQIVLRAESERADLHEIGWSEMRVRDAIVSALVQEAESVAAKCAICRSNSRRKWEYRLDRILTGRFTGAPVMIALLMAVLWLTICGANSISDVLQGGLFALGDVLYGLFVQILPEWLSDLLINGIWQVLAWVVSVMLPPMAIFFPLFTLLEDVGYLPRIAFNLDRCFRRAGACGKQALTMCMGFGCNAAGVTGCRIIDSPRERAIAMITNSFVPCNGRFPPPS